MRLTLIQNLIFMLRGCDYIIFQSWGKCIGKNLAIPCQDGIVQCQVREARKMDDKAWNWILIYTNNQAAIGKLQSPNNKSGQSLVQNLVTMIDGLRATGVEIDLRWVPAHVGIPGNEKADIEAKKATGLRKMRKRNNKVVEVDTKYTALPAHGTELLPKCVCTTLAKSALAEWRREWETETKGRHLRLLVNAPTRDILEIHKGLG